MRIICFFNESLPIQQVRYHDTMRQTARALYRVEADRTGCIYLRASGRAWRPVMAAGNAAANDSTFGQKTIDAFIDAINGYSTLWRNQAGMPEGLYP